MMEVGFSEILLISVLALIVLGPEKLPKVAAEIGRWVGRARSMARQFRDQLEEEASLEPSIKKPAAAATSPAPDINPVPDINYVSPVSQPVSSAEPAAEPTTASTAPEIIADHAELTPHPPMQGDTIADEPLAEEYVARYEAEAASQSAAIAHAERLPRL